MADVNDMDLMREYADRNSEPAFAELVHRHINLVYSAALRHTGNSQDAQDVTQAVFILLAKKAAGLRQRTTLSGWLYETTRFTARQLLRTRARQQVREQEAYMQSTLNDSDTDTVWRQLAPLLEDAMTRLSEKDRTLLVLRFFENKSSAETAALLGIQEWAAHKRASRALEKLRRFFTRRGVNSTTDTIAGAISAHSVHAAPVALAKTVTAAALAKGAAASASTLTLVKATLIAMKTKTIVLTTAAAATLVLGTGAFLLTQVVTHRHTALAALVPLKFANDDFVQANFVVGLMNSGRFLVETDPHTKRTANSTPAEHIKCLVKPVLSGPADYLASLNGQLKALSAFTHIRYDVTNGSPLLGNRVRISGWIKASDVRNWAGAEMYVGNDAGHCYSWGDMSDRPVYGTADWQPVDFVSDVPDQPCFIDFMVKLYGAGEIWYDDFQLDVVPHYTPLNDDQALRIQSTTPTDFSQTTDAGNPHAGHPSYCIAYTPEGRAPRGTWLRWGQCMRTPALNKYKGHTVHMSVWLKTEDVGSARLGMKPEDDSGKRLAQDKSLDSHPIRGTADWTLHTITCRIPEKTDSMDTGVYLEGRGKLWIDAASLKYENVK